MRSASAARAIPRQISFAPCEAGATDRARCAAPTTRQTVVGRSRLLVAQALQEALPSLLKPLQRVGLRRSC
jgi:hypothetical protein